MLNGPDQRPFTGWHVVVSWASPPVIDFPSAGDAASGRSHALFS